jgi:glyoxylase-like metal-dependent hydrolase (beta-lactamase superfamily II)
MLTTIFSEQRGGLRFDVFAGSAAALSPNCVLISGERDAILIDVQFVIDEARELAGLVRESGKQLKAAFITHAHPDHYGGGVELVGSDEIPIVAAEGVDAVIRRDDEIKEGILRPMFGDEWPRERRFPNQTVSDGESISFDGVSFTLMDLGPGESPHDSVWLVGDERLVAFAGDTAYQHMHCFLADGYWESWLANIGRLRTELAPGAELHFGHGDPAATSPFDWQEGYISAFIEAIQEVDWSDPDAAKARVVARMTDYLPSGELQFLMELSIEPVAAKLGLIQLEPDRKAD